MKINLYRSYLFISEMETNISPYGQRLFKQIIFPLPELHGKNMQNIVDQNRQLFVKNILDPNIAKEIRYDVAHELGMATPTHRYIK